MPAIEIFAIAKTYEVGFWRKTAKAALHPLSLAVEEGEVFGYLGPNGAGKSTTLKLLMGLIFPTTGTAKILGRRIDDPAVKVLIGFLPEQPYFYDYLTATELLDYYARISGVPARDRSRRIDAVLARVGLANVRSLQLRKFSKGMLQRVGIAQAMVHEPKVFFLDEPMSGLDPMGRREMRDIIQGLKDEGKTIFFSTHILSDAETLCDRVAVLNQGELRGVGVVAELASRMSGRTEVVWQGAAALPGVKALEAAEIHCTGETLRAVISESHLDKALDALRSSRARLISVTPVRQTLEDYFVERLEAAGAATADGAARSAMPGDACK
ncbi:MAG: ABC transporter ATP-binding protein [Terriglobales bacterium]